MAGLFPAFASGGGRGGTRRPCRRRDV